MKTHRKPDLLFILAMFVGIGFLVSSYIQYSHANANADSTASLAAKGGSLTAAQMPNKFLLVSSHDKTDAGLTADSVNSSPK